ncbi:VRR-NUC domain-containing protein [Candidatus Proelusimicrobium volucris]|uniref:VRR-NUC domain-containing protein n=1 Tax=Candidatus Proelusimicrobium volucris TaxID=3416225 RepID=UPI003D11A32D
MTSEYTVQTQICNTLRALGVTFFKVANEQKFRQKNPAAYFAKLKREGYCPGVADLVVLLNGGRTVFFEVKKPKEYTMGKKGNPVCVSPAGKQSPAQAAWAARVKAMGFDYYIVYSAQQAADIINGIRGE